MGVWSWFSSLWSHKREVDPSASIVDAKVAAEAMRQARMANFTGPETPDNKRFQNMVMANRGQQPAARGSRGPGRNRFPIPR